MEARLDELLARPPVYAKEDGDGTELDKLKKREFNIKLYN